MAKNNVEAAVPASGDDAQRLRTDETNLRTALASHEQTQVQRTYNAFLMDISHTKNPGEAFKQVSDADKAAGLEPMLLFDKNKLTTSHQVDSDVMSVLNPERASTQKLIEDKFKNSGKGDLRDAINFDADDIDFQFSRAKGLPEQFKIPSETFLNNLRTAFNASGQRGREEYMRSVNEQLEQMNSAIRISPGRSTRFLHGDPSLKPGNYGAFSIVPAGKSAADGREFNY